MHNTRGGIGYVENAYATQNHLITTQLRNKAGQFVDPTMASFSAGGGERRLGHAKNFAVDLIDQPGDKSWPIVSATFIELPKDPKDPARSRQRDEVLRLGVQERRQHRAASLEYIPLPDPVKDAVRERLALRDQGPGRQAGHVRAGNGADRRITAFRADKDHRAAGHHLRHRRRGAVHIGDADIRRPRPLLRRLRPGAARRHHRRAVPRRACRRSAPFGPLFLVSADWDPVKEVFGAAVPVYGTIVTSILALVFAVPLSFGIAFYLTELAPVWVRRPVGTAIELLAAVPSIIYGMWGFFVIVPLMAEYVQPSVIDTLDGIPVLGRPVRRARPSAPASSPPRSSWRS